MYGPSSVPTAGPATTPPKPVSGNVRACRVHVERLLLKERGRYLAYLRRRLSRPDEVEDAFQEFCVRALAKAEQIRDLVMAEAWLQRVLFTTLQDAYRLKRTEARRLAELRRDAKVESAPSHDPENNAAHPRGCRCITAHISALRPEYRHVLWEVDVRETPREAVARKLDISDGNLRVRLHRARASLRSTLKTACPPCGEGRPEACDCTAHCNARERLAS